MLLCLAEATFKPRPPWEWEAERISQHQSSVLATAFFIVEQFGALVSTTDVIGRLLTRLTNHLVRLATAMLHDTPREFTPPVRLAEAFHGHFGETQASLVCGDCVAAAWARGIQRLVLGGALRREDCEALAKHAVDRVASANSTRLRVVALNLLSALLYVLNADFLSRGEAAPPAEAALSTSTEYLTTLWQCLRQSPCISPFQARCIGLSLKHFLEDLGRGLLSAADASTSGLNGLVNKAITEVARVERVYARLAFAVLGGVVKTFSASHRGSQMVREWVLLALPSLLQRHRHKAKAGALQCHAYWVAAICVLLVEAAVDAESNREAVHSLSAHKKFTLLNHYFPPVLFLTPFFPQVDHRFDRVATNTTGVVVQS